MESKLAAPRLDFIELLAGEVAVFSPFSKGQVGPGEISPALSPHVRLRVADIYTSHRREPQVEVDMLSTFDGLPLQHRDQPLRQVSVCGCLA